MAYIYNSFYIKSIKNILTILYIPYIVTLHFFRNIERLLKDKSNTLEESLNGDIKGGFYEPGKVFLGSHFMGGVIMFFRLPDQDPKEFLLFCINNTRTTVEHYEHSVKYSQLLVEYWKEKFKTSLISEITTDTFQGKLEFVRYQKDELQRQKEHLAQLEVLYEQQYGNAQTRKIIPEAENKIALHYKLSSFPSGLRKRLRLAWARSY